MGRKNGKKAGRRGVVTAVVTVTLAAIAVAAMPIGIALTTTAPTKARGGVTVFDMFDLSPEQFATMMSNAE